MIYIVAFALTLILLKLVPRHCYLGIYKRHKTDLTYLIVSLPLTLITVLRYDVGVDYWVYTHGHYENGLSRELVHQLIIKFAHVFTEPHIIIVFYGLLFN